jgi:hypothetical protein
VTAVLMGRPGCPLAPPRGLGARTPKQEKVHIASKWDTDLVSWSCMEFLKNFGGWRGGPKIIRKQYNTVGQRCVYEW